MTDTTGVIQVLDELTANQIAAGEVVERPLSVVKELVENSIDAGARRITIQIEGGGLTLIKVGDDGSGMSKTDMPQAFLRHATSKIQNADDLFSIHTMGFRGEALPSIASVSQVEMQSREKTAVAGYRITVTDNEIKFIGEVGMPVGTQITVKELFYNTPVRKKFMKSPSTEMGYIISLVGQLILANPNISFVLQNDGRVVLNSAGRGDLLQAVISIYGRQMADNMTKVDWQSNLTVKGYVSLPPFSRGSRKYYHFFVNGRLIKSKDLANIVELAYDTLLPSGRYPAVILALTLPPASIDVNVHPAKTEIRFNDLPLVKAELLAALKAAVKPSSSNIPELAPELEPNAKTEDLTYKIPDEASFIRLKENKQPDNRVFEPVQKPKTATSDTNFAAMLFANMTGVMPDNPKEDSGKPVEPKPETPKSLTETESAEATGLFQALLGGINLAADTKEAEPKPEPYVENIFRSMRPLGQIDGTYIAAVAGETLYLVDQHAAHERVRYEKFQKAYLTQEQSATMLALPVTVELGAGQKEILLNQITKMADLGFIVEYFGDNTFILRGVPTWFWQQEQDGGYKQGAEEFFITVLDKLNEDKNIDISRWNREELFTCACKSAVKANQYLTDSDITWLFSELAQAEKPLTCPHGRPVAIKISKEEISRRFLRG